MPCAKNKNKHKHSWPHITDKDCLETQKILSTFNPEEI